MYLSNISVTVIVLFLSSLALPLIIFSTAIKSAGIRANMYSKKIRNIQIIVIGFLITWWLFASFLSLNGALYGNTLPPRPILFLILPLILFLFLVVRKTNTFKILFEAVRIETLIKIHIFRLIGGWFIFMGYHNLLPFGFALRAGVGDILTGILALLISFAVYKKKILHTKWVYAWNIFGLVDILAVIISAAVITSNVNTNPATTMDVLELTTFPFALIPAFAPAIIIFLHIITFQKLSIVK